jgi:hypothetical protein
MTIRKRTALPLALALGALGAMLLASVASATHPRPISATPVTVSLVPAYNECTGAGNRTHGPPLVFPSCNPPVQSSTRLTIGTPDANGANASSRGSLQVRVKPGVPGPPDDSDVKLIGSSTDVRCKPASPPATCNNTTPNAGTAGNDYVGELEGNAMIRITDHWNAVAPGGGTDAATVIDIPFPVTSGCVATASTAIGGTCTVNTTANAIFPPIDPPVKDGKRAIVGIQQIQVFDGGLDGQAGTTGDNTLFAVQGIFIP